MVKPRATWVLWQRDNRWDKWSAVCAITPGLGGWSGKVYAKWLAEYMSGAEFLVLPLGRTPKGGT